MQVRIIYISLTLCGKPSNPDVMFHQGYALKIFLQKHSSVNEVASILEVSRQAINGLYGQEKFSREYVHKLSKAGLKIEGITVKASESNIVNNEPFDADTPLESSQDKYIASLEETVKLQREMIQILKDRLGIK